MADEVLDLYHMLEHSRKEFEGDIEEDGEARSGQGASEAGAGDKLIENMLTAVTNASMNGGGGGGEFRGGGGAGSFSAYLPMMSEMAKAINALSEQVSSIAREVSEKPGKVAAPVRIQVEKIEKKMFALQKANAAAAPMNREMLLQMNALLNPGGVRRMRSGGLRPGSNEYMRSPNGYERHNHKHLLGLHSVPDAL